MAEPPRPARVAQIARLQARGLDAVGIAARLQCSYRDVAKIVAAIRRADTEDAAGERAPLPLSPAQATNGGATPPSVPSPADDRPAGDGSIAASGATSPAAGPSVPPPLPPGGAAMPRPEKSEKTFAEALRRCVETPPRGWQPGNGRPEPATPSVLGSHPESIRYEDDPRAVADRGSFGKLPPGLLHSPSGSSLDFG